MDKVHPIQTNISSFSLNELFLNVFKNKKMSNTKLYGSHVIIHKLQVRH